ncbi:hypothetical protein ACFQXA_30690 [Nocardiopsis composta]
MAELPYPPPPGLSAALGLAGAQHGVLGRDQALRSGLSANRVDGLVRSRRWRILRPGVYYVRDGPPPLAARAKAAQLVYGPRAVVAGPTAARLWEMQGPVPGPGFEHIHLSVPGRGRGTATGIRLHGWDVPPGEVTLRHGIRLTTPGRTLRDTVLLTDRHTAVSVLDSALQQGLADPGDLPGLRDANAGRAGAPRSRAWWEEADGRAQSTFETRLRLVCADAGVAPETLQYPVHTADGGLAGHADLAWPSWGWSPRPTAAARTPCPRRSTPTGAGRTGSPPPRSASSCSASPGATCATPARSPSWCAPPGTRRLRAGRGWARRAS